MDDAETNRKFAESLDADYPILSDADKQVANAYGVLGATGFPGRWTFYIAADGRILDIDRKVSARTAGEDVARRLGELGVRRQSI